MPMRSRPPGSIPPVPLAIALLLAWQPLHAGPLPNRILEHRLRQAGAGDVARAEPVALRPAARVVRDVAYGNDPRQRMDVYLPPRPAGAPVIFMVHGGAWFLGDKGADAVVRNKVARWVAKGFILVSTNYRMLPEADPLEQARDVAAALATAQRAAPSWGGDPARFIVMGHSAGAHLVALLAASPGVASAAGARPWLGTIGLDSAAYDVVTIMKARHARLYDRAFGSDPAYWRAASPLRVLSAPAAPFLAVCSTQRSDSCPQATRFVTRMRSFHVHARVLEEDLSHMEIDRRLGLEGAYTLAVESFMGTLDPTVRRMLTSR